MRTSTIRLLRNLLAVLLMAAAGQGSAWAQTFTIEASHDNSTNVTTFTITRSGTNLPAQTIYYRTVNLSAYAGKHYTAVNDTYTFPAGVTTKQVMVTESSQYTNEYAYHYQTGGTRSYRFEVLDVNGFELQHYDRSMTTGAQFSNTYLNKTVTDLVYFTDGGSITTGTGNKYLDVSYSSSSWTQVTDAGYDQGVHTVSTNSLYNSNSTLRTILNGLGYKMYATVYFSQKEEHDGYQYIQIYTGNAGTYDNVDDPNGGVGTLTNSLYRACFILSKEANVMTSSHYQFFPHRYGYYNKAAETTAGIDHYEFDYSDSYLYEQKYISNSYKASTSGSLVLSPTAENINIRFDAGGGGSDNDEWDFKNLKVRLALVDGTYPTLVSTAGITVSAGPYIVGNTFYISVPFSEIVHITGASKKLNTSWGDVEYFAGDNTNVITFKGTINASVGTTLAITGINNCLFNDLAGNYDAFGTSSFNKTFTGVTCLATYTLAATNTAFSALDGDYWVSDNDHLPQPHPTTFYFYKGIVNTTNRVSLAETTNYTLAWSNNTAAGNGTVTATGTGNYTGSVSTTFPIRWSTYTVAFHSNGSTGIPVTGTMSDQSFQYGVAQNLTTNAFSRTGFNFAGWNTQPDGSGTAYTDGQSVTGLNPEDGGTVDLYAQWTVIPWAGTGNSEDNPYVILYASQLDSLAATVNSGTSYSGKFFMLDADIVYDGTVSNYTAIGHNSTYYFDGTFDGNNHTISGIRIHTTADGQGVFGQVGINGIVKNVVLANSTITAHSCVGGIVGYNIGTLTNCRVEGSVEVLPIDDLSLRHGGIVGQNHGTVSGCISAANVDNHGIGNVRNYGGIVGDNDSYGTVKDCLYTGSTVSALNYYGAIAGTNAGTLTNNYYTTENLGGVGNGQSNSSGSDCDGARRVRTVTLDENVTLVGDETIYDVSGLTAIGTGSYALSYNDGTTTTLYSGEGQTLTFSYNGVPSTGYVWNGFSATGGGTFTGNTLTMPADNTTVSATTRDVWGVTSGHDGTTEATAYLISDTVGLNLLARYVNGTHGYAANDFSGKYFKLANNITYSHEGLGATESNYSAIGGRINDVNRYFRGTFDGDNDTISGIRIYRGGTTSADGNQGLFGQVSGGTIRNVTLTDAVITGRDNVGGIAGYISRNNSTGGIIENCHVTSGVILHAVANNAFNHGGIVGNVNSGSVSGCTSAATLTVANNITGCTSYGGIVGMLNGNLQNCLVLGATVGGTNQVGAGAGVITSNCTCSANYYRGCTVNGTANATGVGIGSEFGETPPKDIDGIRSLHTLTLGDGVSATGSETKVIGDVTYYASASTITLSGTPASGYSHIGYSYNDGSDHTVEGNSFTMPAADLTVSAIFTPITYSITYDLADGSLPSGQSNPATYTIETPTITLTNPTRTGYTFVGWTGTGLDAATTTVTVAQGSTGDRSYTATWTPIVYNITYDLAGGSASNPATYTIETPDFTLNNPTREGYTFAGWTGTGLDAATTSVTIAQGSTGDRSYTATWTPIVYNITYNLGGGNLVTPNPATYTVETPDFTLNNPTREGYTFAGWTGTGLDAATTSVTIAQGSTGNRSYTATWEVIPWTGSGSESNPYIILYASQLDLLATLVNNNNAFDNTFFQLGADIAYPHITDWDDASSTESNYTAIGSYNSFNGTFDGCGHTVSGIRIYRGGSAYADRYQGLFGSLGDNANVKNVTLADARITGDQYVGGIAGRNDGNIDNCVSSSVAVTATNSGNADCGGITGYGIWGDISNCLVLNASVSGSSNYIGAIAGDAGNNNIFSSLYYNCTVGGVENATGVGCNGSDRYDDFRVVPAYRMTLAPNVTASNTFAYGEHYYIARNRIVTLDYSGAVDYDQAVVYSVNGNELPLNSFTVTADTVVTAAVVTAIQTIPYSYDFEDETPFRYWRPLTGSYSLTHSGYNNTYCFRIFGTTSNLMLLPPFDAEVNTLMLNLKFRSAANNENYGTFSVGYVTDAADTSTFTAVATYSYAESQGNWLQKTEYFTGIPAGARLALRSNPVRDNSNWYVDDIEVAVAPSCIPPQDLTLTTVDATSATVAWRTVNGAQWEYCLLDSDREPVDADFVASTTASSVSFDNLTPVTDYRFHLRRRCDAQSTSTVGTLNFTTPALVPFTDDFETTQCRWTVKANSTNCWCQGSAVNNGGSQALYISDDGGTSYHSSYGSGYFYAYMRFSLAAGVYAFSYDWTNNDYGFLRVALVPDNIDLDKSNISNYLNNRSNPPSGWLWLDGNGRLQYHPDWVPRTEVVDVSAAGLYKMVFFWYNYGECNYPAAVDNVRVTIPRTFTTAGRWDVASNWSPAGVPAADESVVVHAAATIPSGCVAIANNISVANDGSLTLADGAQLVCNNNVRLTVQKQVGAGQWNGISGLYGVGDLSSLTTGTAYDLFHYDEEHATWHNLKTDNDPYLNSYFGYIYRRADNATLNLATYNYSYNYGSRYYARCSDDALRGFNLIGNYCTHDVYFGTGITVEEGSLAPGFYTLNADGTWRAHTFADPIHVAQSFLIQVTTDETLLRFYNTAAAPGSKGKGSGKWEVESLSFTVTDGEHSDVAYALFAEGDGLRKFGHQNADLPSLSIAQGDGRYAIFPLADDAQSFDLAFRGKAGEYTISLDNLEVLENLDYLHLLDRATGNDIDLLRHSTYTFTVAAGTANGAPRFLVKLAPTTEHSTLNTEHFAVLYGDQFIIQGTGLLTAYDVVGRQLFSREVNSELRIPNSKFPSAGIYVLKLNTNTQKIVIR